MVSEKAMAELQGLVDRLEKANDALIGAAEHHAAIREAITALAMQQQGGSEGVRGLVAKWPQDRNPDPHTDPWTLGYIRAKKECADELEAALAAMGATQQPEAQAGGAVAWRVDVLPVAVNGADEARRVEVTIGAQTFRVGEDYWDTREEAEWYAGQLRHALSRALYTTPPATLTAPGADDER